MQHCNLDAPVAQVCPEVSNVKWDVNKLMLGVREGLHRRAFVEALESDMEAFVQSCDNLLEQRTPDLFFIELDKTVIKCAAKFFSTDAKEVPAELAALRKQRMQLLRERRELRTKIMAVCRTESNE